MIKTVVYCDFCEKPIPEEFDDFGSGPVRCISLGETKLLNTKTAYPHMCKTCAEKIDNILRDYKIEMAHQAGLASMYAQINKERREMLGSEG